jgi:cyclase
MRKVRLIPRLDIKGPSLIKGIQLEGLRVIGDPNYYAKKYYEEGADEILYMDAVASLYGRNSLKNLIAEASKDVFVPITVGGGIRTLEDATEILRNGADKIAVNTAAVLNPKLISDLANKFGSQSVVISIEARKKDFNTWNIYIEQGREKTDLNIFEWIKKSVALGAGEVLLTSIDNEGTGKGFDFQLVKMVTDLVNVPVIASGGMGKLEDLKNVVLNSKADGVSMADILHYNKFNLKNIREYALVENLKVRKFTF